MTALRFFFRVTVQRFDIANHLPLVRQPRRLPVVLSPEEVTRLLEAARGPKYKAALALAYGAGLRVSEIVSLKVSDIDSKRMMTRVEQSKGRKDRYVMLSPHLLELLRTWWLVLRPAPSFTSIPHNGVSPRHQDRHLMISCLRPPAPKVRRLFRRFSTGHDEAQTSTTAACRVPGSILLHWGALTATQDVHILRP